MTSEATPSSSSSEASREEASLEDLEIERLARKRRLVRGLRVAARRALVLARRYREEEGPGGQRELGAVAQALLWRGSARDLRAGAALVGRPGLARTIAPTSDAKRHTG